MTQKCHDPNISTQIAYLSKDRDVISIEIYSHYGVNWLVFQIEGNAVYIFDFCVIFPFACRNVCFL